VTTLTEMLWESLVAGLLLYGLAFVGIAVVRVRGGAPRFLSPDFYDAPITVTRLSSRATTATVATRSGYSDN
jgi:hypothetical protein